MHIVIWILIPTLFLFICKFLTEYRTIFNKYIRPFLTWRIIICYIPFWFMFTGWTYVVIVTGPAWLRAIGSSWLAWMCMPWCPEKIITIPAAIWLHRKLFPNHSTATLDNLLKKEKDKLNSNTLFKKMKKKNE